MSYLIWKCLLKPSSEFPSSLVRMRSSLSRMRSSLVRMRSSLVVRASDCQCTSCNGPGFDPSIRRHSGIWGAADEAVLNIVRKKKKNLPKNISKKRIPFSLFGWCAPVSAPHWIQWKCAKFSWYRRLSDIARRSAFSGYRMYNLLLYYLWRKRVTKSIFKISK
jgi:hypothetical protein